MKQQNIRNQLLTHLARLLALAACAAIAVQAAEQDPAAKAKAQQEKVKAQIEQKVKPVAPTQAPATPQKPRKLLIFTLTKGFPHSSIPLAAEAIKFVGENTKAYESVITADPSYITADKLKEFDAICFDQCTGDPFTDPASKAALLDFVKSGKGYIGVHAATDCFYNWKEYGEMVGGYFNGHPFRKISVKLDDPKSPINAMFAGQGYEISDEIYTFRKPYSRDNLHILQSIDWENAAITAKGTRDDNDYALSWIREYGQGRVFYCAFGHDDQIWWNPRILAHYLAGIQYAFGDLKADATPTSKISPAIEPARGPELKGKK